MTVSALMNRTCQIVHRSSTGTEDEYGNVIPAETTTSTVCELQGAALRVGAEPNNYNDLSKTKWTIYLPAGTALESADVVIVDDEEYEVDGDVWEVRNPRTGTLSHIEGAVVKVSGAFDGGAS